MITTDRNEFVGFHWTSASKEKMKVEAERRKTSMSALIADTLDKWLEKAASEIIEEKRSNRRGKIVNIKEEDVPLPLEQK